MNKVYVAYFGTNYDYGEVMPYTSLDKAKTAADKALDYCDYCYVTEYKLVNGDYVEAENPSYEAEKGNVF
jgi:uncharacterized protein YuzB (UPF0349 family)